MNDLNVINRLNAEAVAANIPRERAAGKWVVGIYSGLHFVDYQAVDTAAEAQAFVDAKLIEGIPGNRYQILPPTVGSDADEPVLQASAENVITAPASSRSTEAVNDPVINEEPQATFATQETGAPSEPIPAAEAPTETQEPTPAEPQADPAPTEQPADASPL